MGRTLLSDAFDLAVAVALAVDVGVAGCPILRALYEGWHSTNADRAASPSSIPYHSNHHRHLSVLLARGPHANLDILSKGSKKLHEAFDRKGARAVAHEGRNVWLPNAQDFSGIGLFQAPAP